MGDLIRYILSRAFGVRWCVLEDCWGERRIRRVRWQGGRPYAEWVGFNIRPVYLLDHGRLRNGAYVERWEPYELFARRQWPIPPAKEDTPCTAR